jgi:3-deoxy-D-manno-octulosonic-acid transferase
LVTLAIDTAAIGPMPVVGMNALDCFYAPLALITAPWWARKARGGWRERFGQIEPIPDRPPLGAPTSRTHPDFRTHPRILLHAVSVGEVNAIRRLVPSLASLAQVIVSTTTDTGLARARALFKDHADVVRYPLDFSKAVARFLDATRPDIVALVELEVWPNFIRACAGRGVPVGVINGRLSERSFNGYSRIRRWLSPTFGSLAFACVQDQAYAERFKAMGVREDRVRITGSMKWDAADLPDAAALADQAENLAREMGIDRTRPLIVAGSTAEDEEALLHWVSPPGTQLLCAPRKPEHVEHAARALPGCTRRSDRQPRPADRFLLDTIGELRLVYALADVVVMGRSFGTLYGSDPIEPAALSKPVVIGPMVKDFESIVRTMLDARGIIQTDRPGLPEVLRQLIADRSSRLALGARARACVKAQVGATDRHAEAILGVVKNRLAQKQSKPA